MSDVKIHSGNVGRIAHDDGCWFNYGQCDEENVDCGLPMFNRSKSFYKAQIVALVCIESASKYCCVLLPIDKAQELARANIEREYKRPNKDGSKKRPSKVWAALDYVPPRLKDQTRIDSIKREQAVLQAYVDKWDIDNPGISPYKPACNLVIGHDTVQQFGLPSPKTGLPPVVDENTEILILGTLPGDKSLKTEQYYANPRNDFWKIIESVLDQSFENLTYDAKIEMLRAHHIGLWDAFHTCVRPGSMDRNITEQELNDFSVLKQAAPSLRLICFNGEGAMEAAASLRTLEYEMRLLPSSSPANRRDQAERLRRWKEVFDGFRCGS